jgi:hypothetical protein
LGDTKKNWRTHDCTRKAVNPLETLLRKTRDGALLEKLTLNSTAIWTDMVSKKKHSKGAGAYHSAPVMSTTSEQRRQREVKSEHTKGGSLASVAGNNR